MITYSDDKVWSFFTSLYKEVCKDNLEKPSVEILENTNKKVRVRISKMYDYVPLSFAILSQVSAFFDTMEINEDRYQESGCETCDYGSSYELTLIITPSK